MVDLPCSKLSIPPRHARNNVKISNLLLGRFHPSRWLIASTRLRLRGDGDIEQCKGNTDSCRAMSSRAESNPAEPTPPMAHGISTMYTAQVVLRMISCFTVLQQGRTLSDPEQSWPLLHFSQICGRKQEGVIGVGEPAQIKNNEGKGLIRIQIQIHLDEVRNLSLRYSVRRTVPYGRLDRLLFSLLSFILVFSCLGLSGESGGKLGKLLYCTLLGTERMRGKNNLRWLWMS